MSTSTKDESSSKPFPAKAKVILHGLKAADFNGKVGIVQSSSLNEEGRQQVLVEELGKTVALKVANLQYQERPLDSLSNKELKNILRYKKDVLKFQGMDKADLQAQLKDLSTDPMEIAEWLAHANSSGNSSSTAADSSSTSATADSSNADPDIQDGLSQFDQMTPEQLRQQAMMMKSMPPATLRQMNPQLAHMSDAQIVQAAQQMEMMASNPQMMQMARNQMKNMTPAQKAQYKQMMASQPQAKAGTPAAAGGNPLENMTPEQMRQQAQMMKSMPPDTLRQMNPQLAHMSDAQIAQAAQQMEMMASNPELVKMATEQMKNMSPEQMQAMMRQQAAGGGGGANSMNPMMMGGGKTNNNGGDMSFDPAKMLETMDTAQIKQMMQGLKSNPELLQQLAAQTGMPKEGLEKTIAMFSDMSDDQLESSLKSMAKFQKVIQFFQNIWIKANAMVGGHLKKVVLSGGIAFVVILVLYFLGGGDNSSSSGDAMADAATKLMQQQQEEAAAAASSTMKESVTAESVEDEFAGEF